MIGSLSFFAPLVLLGLLLTVFVYLALENLHLSDPKADFTEDYGAPEWVHWVVGALLAVWVMIAVVASNRLFELG